MVKVSVLMPVYNTKEEYLKESIESILDQTFQDFELIIVDDGSFNNVEEIVKTYNNSKIRFYKNEQNIGVSKTRNRLMDLAKGKYCAWQDADDISCSNRLEKQVKFLDNNPDISIVGANLIRFPSKKVIKQIKSPKILDFIGGCAFSQGTSMLRADDFKKNKLFYNENLITSEDYELWSRAVKILNFANIDEVLLKYRRVETSLCHSKNQYAYDTEKKIKQNLLDYLTQNTKLQNAVIKAVNSVYKKESSLLENIFSIRNEWYGDKKIKILIILGIKIKLKNLREV